MIPYGRRHHDKAVADAPAVDVIDMSASYAMSETPALRNVSCSVNRGSRVALVGANGAGKSTLLGAIVGVLKPTSGSVRVFGVPPTVCQHRMSYLAQRTDLDWKFPITVRGLVLTGRYVHLGWFKRPSSMDRDIAQDALRRLGVERFADRQVNELSGGQQQRVLLARALAQGSDLYLMDEPTNAVDADTRHVLWSVLDQMRSEGKTVIVATHDHGRLDEAYDSVIYLHEGRRVESPPPIIGHDHDGCCGTDHAPAPTSLGLGEVQPGTIRVAPKAAG